MDELSRTIVTRIIFSCADCGGHPHPVSLSLELNEGDYAQDPGMKVSVEFGDDCFKGLRLEKHDHDALKSDEMVHDLYETDHRVEFHIRTLVDLAKLVVRKQAKT